MILYAKKNLKFEARNFVPDEIERESEFNTFVLTEKLNQTLEGCDQIREHLGQAVMISDGCRFSGSKTSQHYFKNDYNALDIYVKGMSSIELMKVVENLDLFTGRGLYPEDQIDSEGTGFIHVDTRRGLYPNKSGNRISRWYRDGNGDYYSKGNNYNRNAFDGLLK